jgi:hypothetical protein
MMFDYYVWVWRQVITHVRESHRNLNQYTPHKGKLDNTMYTLTPGPYVRLPFAKSLQGRNRSSTLRMKSWFHSDRPALLSS